MKHFFDTLIIGGGASGLMCAVTAKQHNSNKSVAVIEKNDRVGKKLMSTGNGRCNLTNKNICSEKYSGSFVKQSEHLLGKITADDLLYRFEELGLHCICDNEGRYYPLCKQANAVTDTLRFACERLGVEIFCKETIKSLRKSGDCFEIKCNENIFTAKQLVICCGSKAAPKLGGSASAADYLKNFGHKVIPFSPALCPIKVGNMVLKSLKGIRSEAKAVLYDRNGAAIKSEHGEVQFTEDCLSGICIFNLSLYADKGYEIGLDLLTDISNKELFIILSKHKELFSNNTIDELFTGIFQKRLGQAILKQSGINDFSRKCNSFKESEISAVVNTVKDMRFKVEGNCGFEKAQASLGGVFGREIDEKTMESRRVKGLFICGEAIDICGECGGYNLHFAFASGITAGENL